MLRVVFASAVFAAVVVNEAHAERPSTGQDLLRLCEAPANQYDRDYCLGYARGVEMSVRMRDEEQQTCTFAVPPEVTERELLGSVITSLRGQPALLKQPAIDVVRAALTNGWPCN